MCLDSSLKSLRCLLKISHFQDFHDGMTIEIKSPSSLDSGFDISDRSSSVKITHVLIKQKFESGCLIGISAFMINNGLNLVQPNTFSKGQLTN